MSKIVVSGAAGRVGSRIIALMKETPGLTLSGAIEASTHPRLGQDAGEAAGIGRIGVSFSADAASALTGADVLIDFSHATVSLGVVREAVARGAAVVVGTTGLDAEQAAELKELSAKVPIVWAPNMSVGVNLLLRVLADVATVLGDAYDVEIVEAHHKLKKDAPSGTALKMAEVIAQALDRDLATDAVYARKGMIGERTPKEIGIQTIRGGDIVGEHTVYFCGMGERIEITHRVSSRDNFARGALRAASWVAGRAPGLYTMRDVLGLS